MSESVRNIYTAIRCTSMPDYHVTVRYFKSVTPGFARELMEHCASFVFSERPAKFNQELNRVAMFGRGEIRVLLLERPLPGWLDRFRHIGKRAGPAGLSWEPHITTNHDTPCVVTFDRLAVMHKQEVLREWPLE